MKAAWQFELLDCAVMNPANVDTSAFSLSVMPAIMQKFVIKETKVSLGSPMASRSDGSVKGAHKKYFCDMMMIWASPSEAVLSLAVVLRRHGPSHA